jgi:hypothetical protein
VPAKKNRFFEELFNLFFNLAEEGENDELIDEFIRAAFAITVLGLGRKYLDQADALREAQDRFLKVIKRRSRGRPPGSTNLTTRPGRDIAINEFLGASLKETGERLPIAQLLKERPELFNLNLFDRKRVKDAARKSAKRAVARKAKGELVEVEID